MTAEQQHDKPDEVFVIEGRSGDYEPQFWFVCAYFDRAAAEAEAARMTAEAAKFWAERQEIGDGPTGEEPDDEFDKLLEAHDAKCRELVAKWLPVIGDPDINLHDSSSYKANAVKWRSAPLPEIQPREGDDHPGPTAPLKGDTPRTDAVVHDPNLTNYEFKRDMIILARQLERELAEAINDRNAAEAAREDDGRAYNEVLTSIRSATQPNIDAAVDALLEIDTTFSVQEARAAVEAIIRAAGVRSTTRRMTPKQLDALKMLNDIFESRDGSQVKEAVITQSIGRLLYEALAEGTAGDQIAGEILSATQERT